MRPQEQKETTREPLTFNRLTRRLEREICEAIANQLVGHVDVLDMCFDGAAMVAVVKLPQTNSMNVRFNFAKVLSAAHHGDKENQ
jgi:hypothetical protein